MRPEKEEDLKKNFPRLFSQLSWGFECNDGWFRLIWNLAADIQRLSDRKNVECIASQVKEKYGGLRFYMSSSPDEVDDLIHVAELESYNICEMCGNQGKINKGPWYEVRCQECKEK